jgi:hypothetical protein
MRRILKLAIALALTAGTAMADGALPKIITAKDQQKLDGYEKTRAAAIGEARTAGSSADVAVLEAVLSGGELSLVDGFDMTGTWRCRTIKMGGSVPLVIYGWFNCRVSDDGSGWRLEKTSGSQRTTGRFFTQNDTRAIYLGALHMAAEAPLAYGQSENRNQLGIAVRPAENRIRIEFPAPEFESAFDILELQR